MAEESKVGLRHGPLGPNCVHVCVDMQHIFADETPWHAPWMRRILPNVVKLVEARPAETILTRFIPAERPGQGEGAWKRYYENWHNMTIAELGPEAVELLPELKRFVPPAIVIDKRLYSPWFDTDLRDLLKKRGTDTLIVTGGETDVCVPGTVFGAVDLGFRVIVVRDALCSSSDEAHDALVGVFEKRFGQQIEVALVDDLIAQWTEGRSQEPNQSFLRAAS